MHTPCILPISPDCPHRIRWPLGRVQKLVTKKPLSFPLLPFFLDIKTHASVPPILNGVFEEAFCYSPKDTKRKYRNHKLNAYLTIRARYWLTVKNVIDVRRQKAQVHISSSFFPLQTYVKSQAMIRSVFGEMRSQQRTFMGFLRASRHHGVVWCFHLSLGMLSPNRKGTELSRSCSQVHDFVNFSW